MKQIAPFCQNISDSLSDSFKEGVIPHFMGVVSQSSVTRVSYCSVRDYFYIFLNEFVFCLQAARYQMIVLFVIATSTSVASLLIILLAAFHLVDSNVRLRSDRIFKRDKGDAWTKKLSQKLKEVILCLIEGWGDVGVLGKIGAMIEYRPVPCMLTKSMTEYFRRNSCMSYRYIKRTCLWAEIGFDDSREYLFTLLSPYGYEGHSLFNWRTESSTFIATSS